MKHTLPPHPNHGTLIDMVEIADIKDAPSLHTWLVETNLPREACIALAHRAAMRVMPVAADAIVLGDELPIMGILRFLLKSGVAAKLEEYRNLSQIDSFSYSGSVNEARTHSVDAIVNAMHTVVDRLNFARITATSVAHAASAIRLAYFTYYKPTSVTIARTAFSIGRCSAWEPVRLDCQVLIERGDLFRKPIWQEAPILALEQWKALRHSMQQNSWQFWIDWYERALAGEPQPWSLLLKIATQDDAFWQGTDDEVMVRINEIVDRHSLAASFNAEELEHNEQRQRIEARTLSDIGASPLHVALGRLRDAVDEMRDSPAFANQYTALDRDLKRIDDYLAKYSETPLRIYEVCIRTCRQIDLKVIDGSLPDADPVLKDFRTEVDNTALDILGNDPQVAEAVRVRSSARFDRLTDAEKEHFRAVTPKVTSICEEGLAQELQDDIATATDETASPNDQKDARFRWGSRMLRIFRIIRSGVGDYANYVTIANAEHGRIANWFL